MPAKSDKQVLIVNPLDQRALRMVREKVIGGLNDAYNILGSGSQIIRTDAGATGMNCVHYIGFIGALRGVLKYLQEVDDELHGREPIDTDSKMRVNVDFEG